EQRWRRSLKIFHRMSMHEPRFSLSRRHPAQLMPNKALQTDKGKVSRRLHPQEARPLAFAAELDC
ncbi:MAG TPA: hypothetical protein VFY27_00545, partial [Woeseiaceae bacterium]|nr:hypothetical protein [Woeseiaceae bacterium]